MYSDPSRLRQNVVKLRLSDEEHRLVQALVDYTGEQKATLIRELVLQQAMQLLGGDPTGNSGLAAAL
jgi:hypothetical protein